MSKRKQIKLLKKLYKKQVLDELENGAKPFNIICGSDVEDKLQHILGITKSAKIMCKIHTKISDKYYLNYFKNVVLDEPIEKDKIQIMVNPDIVNKLNYNFKK